MGIKRRKPRAAANLSMPAIRDHLLDRTLAHVHRWGTTPLVKQKSVAEHSFFVAKIARRICEILIESKAPVGKINVLKVVDMALMHDEAEAFSGDIVRPFKKPNSELEELIEERASAMLREVYTDIPGADYFTGLCEEFKRKESIEAQIVTVADNIAAFAESVEEARLGNQRFTKEQYSSLGSISYPWAATIKDLFTF